MVSFAVEMQKTTPDAGRQLAAPERRDGRTRTKPPPCSDSGHSLSHNSKARSATTCVKNLVVFVALFGTGMTRLEKNSYGEWIGALFALPFILFSMTGGFLADRFSKRSVMLGVKIFELFIMSLVFAGLWSWNKYLLLAGVFLMGTHSAIFGPSKYGSLPELLPEKKLSWGNGILELGTFMAIILGTVAAAAMSGQFRGRQWLSGVILIALAVMGFISCLGITKIPAADPRRKFNANFPAEIWRQVRAMRGDRPLWLALVGNTYFSFLGMLLLLNLFFYGSETLGVTEKQIGYLSAALALGIGLGSVAAGYLSGGKIEYGLVPLGAFGLSIFSAWLARPAVTFGQSFVLLALLGFSGGFFIVPIAALLQHRPGRENKGQVQATANWWSFVGVFLASGAHWLLVQKLALSPRGIFLVGGVLTLLGAIYVLLLLPDALLRFLLWCATHSLYRIRIDGRDHIPGQGRRALRLQPRFLDGRAAADCLDRPAGAVPDVQGHLRTTLDETVRPYSRRHSHFIRTTSARNAPLAPDRQRSHPQRRSRLHFRRGPDHAHRAVAAVPARHGAHHERCGRAHRAGGARRRAGQPVQLQAGALRVEIAVPHPPSGDGEFRPAAAGERDGVRGAAGRAGTARLRMAASPRPDEAVAPPVCAHRPAASAPVCHGRRSDLESDLRFGAW